ncbi:ferrous iron transport protein B [Desulfoscipio geothermicus]|uniref:Ferrous iron transport protein B n=1 Tax=Desulfoscipio geothermicus DSM 3669 TaxID=1121426 RepID=A0A1I6EAS6_9FIRM|nr:ferrous iron transport protein B [Desulfoscipio geothermicus]SFR14815.1 ferrous iron transport protein B [Desulfoscipio geothermicus DSM 3669]
MVVKNKAEGQKIIVLAGNPNVGKSVCFHRLTGQYVDVSNFPGTTMEFCCGKLGNDFLVDTPGVYGLSALNAEEVLVRDAVLSADLVINVVDAVHLDRDLFLTCQLVDMGVPMMVALNMVDELPERGLELDAGVLENRLGVPVVPTVATTGAGIDLLKEQLFRARPGQPDTPVEKILGRYPNLSRSEALLVSEGDAEVAARHGLDPGDEKEKIYAARRNRVNDICAAVLWERGADAAWATRLGHWLIRPVTGIPLLLVTLWLMYELVGVFFAQTVVGYTEGVIMSGYYEPLVRSLLGRVMDLHSPAGVIMAGQFGLLTMAVTYLLGLLLPLVLGFYLVLSLLEDSGYLPRIAILMDRVMGYLGLNGQAVIPVVLGFGCVTMAIITTRLLPGRRERRIATFLLALSVPCSAQLAFVAAILGSLGPGYMFLYGFIIFSIMAGVGTVLDRLLPGSTAPLLLDLPSMRIPRPGNVLLKTWTRTFGFIKEAFPIFLGGALLLSLLRVTGLMEKIQQLLEPLTTGWLFLPRETAGAIIMGFIRRDFGTAGVMEIPMEPLQVFVALVTLTMFVPCIASTLVIFKERGWREGAVMWLLILALAFLGGGLLARVVFFARAISPAVTLPLTALAVTLALAPVVLLSRRRQRVG